MICTEAVGVDEIDRSPLLLVPEFLYMTSQVARVGFEYYEGQGASPLGELDLATQLATLLAHERAQGKSTQSFRTIHVSKSAISAISWVPRCYSSIALG